MNDRLPVNTTGLKLALIVGGGLLLFIFVGQVLRFMSRIVTWGSFVLVAVLAMYVMYELYTGWTAGDEPQRSVDSASTESDDSVGDLKTEYTEGSLSESELEAELDQLLEDQEAREAEGTENTDFDREL